MKKLQYLFINVVQTLLRVLPFPCRTGLVRIGNPGRDAPVLLTGNFRLTVERVKRALEGIDAYLLVANSNGINVWCAAAGGHLTNHDVISVLKTSGIDKLVDHRQVILPQLAATGVEGKVIHHKTGWKTLWGPVYASAIPEFLANAREKTPAMSVVRFPVRQRVEMAVAWAFPISLLTLVLLPFWREGVVPLAALVWAASFLIFLGFPLYESHLHTTETNKGFIFFDFGRYGVPFFLWVAFVLGLIVYSLSAGEFSWMFVLRWGFSAFIVLLIMGLDLAGSTPMYKSGLHKDRQLRIDLDEELCKGAAFCEQVCPVGVFDVDAKLASLTRRGNCVQCGACIVQCPFDALHFRSTDNSVVEPETIRRFKLNLMGSRTVMTRSDKTE